MKIVLFIIALMVAPLLPGVVNQVKAFFAGRRGPGLFRLYFDLFKLLSKACPRSVTTSWVFDIAPAVGLAATLAAALVFPWCQSSTSPFGAAAAVIFFHLLGVGRFFVVVSSLDTGSAFCGMGASREVQFSALVEPAVFVILGFLALLTQGSSVGLLGGCPTGEWAHHSVSLVLVALTFYAILLSENCRVPFDDPETHLELTMIHEAMILDNAGPDMAFILYGAALKLELMAAFLVMMLMPELQMSGWARAAILGAGVLVVAVMVGVTESVIARMRFLKTPQVLMGAFMLAGLATLLYILF